MKTLVLSMFLATSALSAAPSPWKDGYGAPQNTPVPKNTPVPVNTRVASNTPVPQSTPLTTPVPTPTLVIPVTFVPQPGPRPKHRRGHPKSFGPKALTVSAKS